MLHQTTTPSPSSKLHRPNQTTYVHVALERVAVFKANAIALSKRSK